MFTRFKQRSNKLENIDTGNYTAEEYEGCIVELQLVNKLMGDVRVLRKTLFRDIETKNLQNFSVLDVGAGSGELLRVAARWARKTGKQMRATGVELNERSAKAILQESTDFQEINAVRGDALHLPYSDASFDYVISSLFTHHFSNDQVKLVIREMARVAARRIFVIDLHRHPIAFFFYTTAGKLILHNRLLREDGALSILRSFTVEELSKLGKEAGLKNVAVEKYFPYRLVLTATAQALPGITSSDETQGQPGGVEITRKWLNV